MMCLVNIRWPPEWGWGSAVVDRTEKFCNNWRGNRWDSGGPYWGIWICGGLL